MTDLRNTIAHILEHKQRLAEANEATMQQYVVLPILRALGWDDTNLASMEVLPEYAVEDGKVDYALKVGQKFTLFIECKKWNQSLNRHENQIVTYAVKAGMPIVVLTNGKIWRFYFSWVERTSVSDRIFCEIDIENQEAAISDLERYLLKFNVASGKAERNAKIALKEKGKSSTSEISPIIPNPNLVDDVIDNPSEKRPITILPESDVEWTIDMVRDSLSEDLRDYYEKTYREEKCKIFYHAVAGLQNLIRKAGWRLNPPKLSKMLCGFWLTDNGVIGKIKRIFGILPQGLFPVDKPVGKDGELIKKKPKASMLPRLFVLIDEAEAKQLEREHDGCEFYAVSEGEKVDYIYYDISADMSILFPVLEFAYKKHTGN